MATDNNTFTAGHFTATYNGNPIGTTEQGYDISPEYAIDPIRIDDFGDAIVDGIYRGYNLRLNFLLAEYALAAVRALQHPFDVVGSEGLIQNIGQTLVGGGFAVPLVLTPVAGINSNNKGINIPLCGIMPGAHGSFQLNTKLKQVRCSVVALVNRQTGRMFNYF